MQALNNSNRQSFGMTIARTNGFREIIRGWERSGVNKKVINSSQAQIKKMLPDSFELRVSELGGRAGKADVAYKLVFKNGTEFPCSAEKSSPYDLIKSIRENARIAKEKMIENKGHKAVMGRGY